MPRKSKKAAKDPLPLEHPGTAKEDITQSLILQFQDMMRKGTLTPGSRLPPERELAAYFKVARSSLRQALKVLEIMGVITQKVGDGSYLSSDTSAVLSVPMEFLFLLDDTSVEELSELRQHMEPGLARLAAERATPDDIALLHQSIRDLESNSGNRIKMVYADLAFHRAIFQASQNRLASSFFQTIHRAMARMILVTSQQVELEHTLSFHKPILQAIENHDPDTAARLMSEHLQDAAALLTSESLPPSERATSNKSRKPKAVELKKRSKK